MAKKKMVFDIRSNSPDALAIRFPYPDANFTPIEPPVPFDSPLYVEKIGQDDLWFNYIEIKSDGRKSDPFYVLRNSVSENPIDAVTLPEPKTVVLPDMEVYIGEVEKPTLIKVLRWVAAMLNAYADLYERTSKNGK